MQFLADESCDFGAVRALRERGHDVLAVAENASQTVDTDVLAQARSEDRVVITEDKDFGRLVFADGHESSGVILLRYPADQRASLARDLVALCERLGEGLKGCFVVLEPGRTRVSRLRGD